MASDIDQARCLSWGQKLPKWTVRAVSTLPPIASIERTSRDVSRVPKPEVRVSLDHRGSVLAIGLVLVAASETRVVAEPLIAVETAHAMRISSMAGETMATPLEA